MECVVGSSASMPPAESPESSPRLRRLSRAQAASAARTKRRPGSFARIRRSHPSNPLGTGIRGAKAGGSASICSRMVSIRLMPANGGLPAAIVQARQPRA